MRILVIGGTGFIGRHVVRYLLEMGHDVGVFHRGLREEPLPETIRHIHGTRDRYEIHLEEFRKFAADVVVLMVIPQGNERNVRDFVKTFRGIARRSVVTSSRDVYRAFGRLHRLEGGLPDPVPITEESPLRTTIYPYRGLVGDPAWHDYDDIVVEQVVLNEPDLPASVLRIPVVSGPGDHEFHRTFPYLRRMDDGRPAILLDADRANWQDSRVYVEDVAWAVALAATDERAMGRIYNVAPQHTLAESEWVESIGRAAGWHGRVVPIPRSRLPNLLVRDLDFRHRLALSGERIRGELQYAERIPCEEGMRRTVEWQRSNPPKIEPGLFDYEAEDAALQALGP